MARMSSLIRLLGAALLLLACGAARAQPAAPFSPEQRDEIVRIVREAMKADPTILRDAVIALQSQERDVKEAAARAALDKAAPSLAQGKGDPVAGNPDGDVTVVEFYDLRCPYCRRMLPVIAQLLAKDRKLRWVYKDIPILGPGSVLGARAVLAAQKQGGYQKLHDAVMAGAQSITEDTLKADALRVGLDWDRLRRDMSDPAVQERIGANLDIAHNLGIDGTPVYVVGKRMLPGAVDLAELEEAVAAARAQP